MYSKSPIYNRHLRPLRFRNLPLLSLASLRFVSPALSQEPPLLLLASLRPGFVAKFFKGGARAPWGEPREASVINIIIARINNNNRRILRTSSISLYT